LPFAAFFSIVLFALSYDRYPKTITKNTIADKKIRNNRIPTDFAGFIGIRLIAVPTFEKNDLAVCIPVDAEGFSFFSLIPPGFLSFFGFLSCCSTSDISCSPTTIILLIRRSNPLKRIRYSLFRQLEVFSFGFSQKNNS
jgi:hypothetical protein